MKKKIILLIIIVVVCASMISYKIFYEKEKIEITGEDVYQALNLKDCYRIIISSVKYKEDGVLKGKEQTYIITKEDKLFNEILESIKNTSSNSIEAKDFVSSIINQVTHQIQFDIKNMPSSLEDYSYVNNELLFTDGEAFRKITKNNNFITKVILMQMDNEFKNLINEIQ